MFSLLTLPTLSLAANRTHSVECAAPTSCTLVPGHSSKAVAWGSFEDSIATTGTAKLWVTTTASIWRPHTPATAAYAAGYLEGALSAPRIHQQYDNFVRSQGIVSGHAKLNTWLDDNAAWLDAQIAAAGADDAYWNAIAWQRAQLAGMAAGYNSIASDDSSTLPHLTQRQFEVLNLQGDLSDLLKAIEPSRRPHPETMSRDEAEAYTLRSTHCSALVKLLPDYSELLVGHNMWWGYYTMLSVIKAYDFPTLRGGGHGNARILMTSYPGLLSSTDDFYLVSGGGRTKLAVLETTNPNYNASSYDLIQPSSILFWLRVMAANYLASSGSEWMDVAGRHNSGTYNNMWMVVDYARFTPGQPLVPGTLWVGEQAPGWWHAEDQTSVLAYGYWPSYNKALYIGTVRRVGQDRMVQKYGTDYSYSLTPRAEIFRRDQTTVTGEASMKVLMRANKFQTDPLANHSACNQLACRGDLRSPPIAEGAVNAKFTTSARFANGGPAAAGAPRPQMLFAAGPTWDDQVPFQWSKAAASVQKMPHRGQPDKWAFGWDVYS